MLAHAFLIPSEQPPSLTDIKRALLTYEQVHVPHPDDRELIPPNSFHWAASNMPPIFSISMGAVRPLGKVSGYDSTFQRLLDECEAATTQGSLVVRPAPVYSTGFTLGGVPLPPGIPHPKKIYTIYRALTSNPEFVAAASRGLDLLDIRSEADLEAIAPTGADDQELDIRINGKDVPPAHPPRALFPGFVSSEELRVPLTRACYARLGAITNSILVAEQHDLIPITTQVGTAAVMQILDRNVTAAVDELVTDGNDTEVLRRLRWLESFVFNEFIDHDVLERMSISEVLKLRTRAWGKDGEARLELAKTLRILTQDTSDYTSFRTACRAAIEDYHRARADLDHELTQLRVQVLAEVGLGLTKAGGISVAAEALHKLLSTGSPEIALVLGGAYQFLKLTREHAAPLLDYMKRREDLKRSTGYALFRPYRDVART